MLAIYSRSFHHDGCPNFSVITSLVLELLHQLYAHGIRFQVGLARFPAMLVNFDTDARTSRIIDCFFAFGPSVLFQIGLAIFKINGELLLEVTDDGAFINTMKAYFTTLGDSAYPESSDPRLRSITRFQELLVVAFREFSMITDDVIMSERKKHQKGVVVSIENFAKRSTIRNLKQTGRLDKDQLGKIYDHFQLALLRSRAAREAKKIKLSLMNQNNDEDAQLDQRTDREAFSKFLGDISTWARDETIVRTAGFYEHVERTPVEHELIDRLFVAWDSSRVGSLSFQVSVPHVLRHKCTVLITPSAN